MTDSSCFSMKMESDKVKKESGRECCVRWGAQRSEQVPFKQRPE